jgi:aerobic carbon-monoxide dehydrogenase medium subunit
MKPPPFAYHAPTSLNEALDLLGRLDNARILAGGQSLMPMLNMRFVLPDHVIDINRITDLDFTRRQGDVLEIGALTRQREIEFSPLVRDVAPLLQDAILQVGHRQTRNRGTIGGSLCHLDPAAEMPTAAAAYGAEIVVQGQAGKRVIPFEEFALGFMTSALEPNEMLTAVRYPLWTPKAGYSFMEYARRHGDFAIASAAVLMEADGVGRIQRTAIALGGIAPVPLRLYRMAEQLTGQTGTVALFASTASFCANLEAMEDSLVTADYRRHLAETLLRRALGVAYARATGQPLPAARSLAA